VIDTIPNPFEPKQKVDAACLKTLSARSWAGGFGVMSHGVRLRIRVSDLSLIPDLQNLLPETAKPLTLAKARDTKFDSILSVIREEGELHGSRARRINSFFVDDALVARSHSEDYVLGQFKTWANVSIATLAPRRVFVHAGVVAWRGQAIIIPGSSYSGKSTLVAELVRAGADYLSDEYAVFDAHGRVYPFPKPISMREPNCLDQVDVPVEDFGGRHCKFSKPAGLILLTKYEPGGDWQPNILSSGNGVLGLLEHCSAARRSPKRVLRTLRSVTIRAQVIGSPRGEAKDTAPRILSYLKEQEDRRANGNSRESRLHRV
jgi:hypothetical protein